MALFNRESKIGFIGAGTVAGSLAIVLSEKGYRVVAAASRTFSSAQSLASRVPGCTAHPTLQEVADGVDVAFVTTPDDALSSVVSSISWKSSQAVLHCSGAASLDVLGAATNQGASPGAFHPLQIFSSVDAGVKSIPGTTFAIEGGEDIGSFLREMALAIGGHPVFIKPEDKPLYHLSGVMMGNLLTALGAIAGGLWEHLGSNRDEGVKALMPMMRRVSYNLESQGVPGAVAGPYARGDVGIIRKHLEALQSRAPELLPLYCELALVAVPLALEKGTINDDKANEIRSLVEQFKARTP